MSYNWLIGLGIVFGFSLVLSYLTDRLGKSFYGYLVMFSAFMIWIEFLPNWILILEIVMLVFIIITEYRNGDV